LAVRCSTIENALQEHSVVPTDIRQRLLDLRAKLLGLGAVNVAVLGAVAPNHARELARRRDRLAARVALAPRREDLVLDRVGDRVGEPRHVRAVALALAVRRGGIVVVVERDDD
jgi:hypothetical protein